MNLLFEENAMIPRIFIKNEEGGGIVSFIIPITVSFFLVLIFHLASKLGMGVPDILLEPVFDLWIVFVGVLIAVCVFMRQFFLLFLAVFISFLVTILIYVMYVI